MKKQKVLFAPAAVAAVSTKFDANTKENNLSSYQFEGDEKSDSELVIIDTEDNWIARLFYGGPKGYLINFSLLISITAYLVYTVKWMCNDEHYYRTIIQPLWLPSVIQFFTIVIPMDILMCTFVAIILFPLSCFSRSKVYCWSLGLFFSAIILAAIWPLREYTNVGSRALLIIDWGRLSMKITSFLVECAKDDEVYKKSSVKSLLYFLWIPNLIYKHEYPVARRIRWVKVIAHIWWIFGPGLALLLFIYRIMPLIQVDLLTVDFDRLSLIGLVGLIAGMVTYPLVAWLFIFENFCGLHGELLRYPHLKFFGDPSEWLSDLLTSANTIASKWLSRYIYIPVVTNGGSRMKAMCLTFIVSFPAHDLGFYYVADIFVSYNLLSGATIIPLLLTFKPNSRLNQWLLALAALGVWLVWIGSYPLEFIAWNYSSMTGLDKMCKIRLVPLFVTQLYQNFMGASA